MTIDSSRGQHSLALIFAIFNLLWVVTFIIINMGLRVIQITLESESEAWGQMNYFLRALQLILGSILRLSSPNVWVQLEL